MSPVAWPTVAGSKGWKDPTLQVLLEAPQAAQHPVWMLGVWSQGDGFQGGLGQMPPLAVAVAGPPASSCSLRLLGRLGGKDGSSTVSVAGSPCLWLCPQVAAPRGKWTHSTTVSLVGPLPHPSRACYPPQTLLPGIPWLWPPSSPGSLGLLQGWVVGGLPG